MPFLGRDWRSPGQSWVKTEEGWKKTTDDKNNNVSEERLVDKQVPRSDSLNATFFFIANGRTKTYFGCTPPCFSETNHWAINNLTTSERISIRVLRPSTFQTHTTWPHVASQNQLEYIFDSTVVLSVMQFGSLCLPAFPKPRRSVSARRTCCSLSVMTWLPRRGRRTSWTTTPKFHVSRRAAQF